MSTNSKLGKVYFRLDILERPSIVNTGTSQYCEYWNIFSGVPVLPENVIF